MDTTDKEILVQIRSTSLNETLQVKIMPNQTILTLKKAIESAHPQHPKTDNQRIIYSGKLLQDTDILSKILEKSDQEIIPTFHLVVKPSLDAAVSHTQTPMPATAHPYPQSPHSHSRPSLSSLNASPSAGVPHNTDSSIPPYQQPPSTYPSSLPGGYQVVSINGQYYLAPTLVLAQNLSPQQPLVYQHPSAAFISTQPLPRQQQQQQQQQQNNLFFGGNRRVLAQPANAQRAASIWLALKLIVVLFMVCQGASIERIFIFHVIAFIFFLYQTGRLRVVLRRVRAEDINRFRPGGRMPRPAAAAAADPLPPRNANGDGNAAEGGASTSVDNDNHLLQRRQNRGEASTSSGNSAGSGSGAYHTASAPPARPLTALDVWKRGAYTFFASLWPTYGVDPQIAQAFQNENNNQQ